MAVSKPLMDKFHELQEKKDAIESEMKELSDVLESQGVGMAAPLTDQDDYPRADIDIYSVRHARHRMKCLQTDHRGVMEQVEDLLHQIHAEARAGKMEIDMDALDVNKTPKRPFVLVDRVDEGAPAHTAGLKVGDEVVKFGHVNISNYQNLQTIGKLVQESKGKALEVIVLRSGEVVNLTLTPQTWAGRGMLGCNIVPIKR